ncbi:hypothetical protein KIN_30040 [Litoreibacter roseus]|uniref:Uncharacterized protein n=1 Tax=Litoreibacter roseus TaxID=2601869 RepID=A0A6N6JJC5_9RHOB|nr:hypothetical protein KIN_30040 [Litoreibacter roseus]
MADLGAAETAEMTGTVAVMTAAETATTVADAGQVVTGRKFLRLMN